MTFFHQIISFSDIVFTPVGLLFFCIYSCPRRHARFARFSVRDAEVFSRQLFRPKIVIHGQHL